MTPRQARKPLPPGRWRKAATETHMVSDQGQVWSLHRQRLLVGVLSRRGYLVVSGGRLKKASVYVHRLVLEAFVGPMPAGGVTRHLNGIKADNRLENLTYGTHSENAADTLRLGMNTHANKASCLKGHPYDGLNTYHMPAGGRDCRRCVRERGDRYRARKRQRDNSGLRYLPDVSELDLAMVG